MAFLKRFAVWLAGVAGALLMLATQVSAESAKSNLESWLKLAGFKSLAEVLPASADVWGLLIGILLLASAIGTSFFLLRKPPPATLFQRDRGGSGTSPASDLEVKAEEYVDHVAKKLAYVNDVCAGVKDQSAFARKIRTQRIDVERLVNYDVSALSLSQKAAHEALAIEYREMERAIDDIGQNTSLYAAAQIAGMYKNRATKLAVALNRLINSLSDHHVPPKLVPSVPDESSDQSLLEPKFISVENTKDQLRSFFVQSCALIDRASPLSNEAGMTREITTFVAMVADWLGENRGAAARARFLDLGPEGNPNSSSLWNLKTYRQNLKEMIESGSW